MPCSNLLSISYSRARSTDETAQLSRWTARWEGLFLKKAEGRGERGLVVSVLALLSLFVSSLCCARNGPRGLVVTLPSTSSPPPTTPPQTQPDSKVGKVPYCCVSERGQASALAYKSLDRLGNSISS